MKLIKESFLKNFEKVKIKNKLLNFSIIKEKIEKNIEILNKYFGELDSKDQNELIENIKKLLFKKDLFLDNELSKDDRKIIYLLKDLNFIKPIKIVSNFEKQNKIILNYWLIL